MYSNISILLHSLYRNQGISGYILQGDQRIKISAEIIKDHGCPWDEETCEYAATKGHLEVLKYAHENGCPWDIASFHHDLDLEGSELSEEVLAYLETLGDQSS